MRIMRSMHWCAQTSPTRCQKGLTRSMWLRCCARASSAFAVSGLPAIAWRKGWSFRLWKLRDSGNPYPRIMGMRDICRDEVRGAPGEGLPAVCYLGGKGDDLPPVELDRAITFAPSRKVVVAALSSLRKGDVVAINAIHLDSMPAFDYDKVLWGERQIRSLANMARQNAIDFLRLAHMLNIQPQVSRFT